MSEMSETDTEGTAGVAGAGRPPSVPVRRIGQRVDGADGSNTITEVRAELVMVRKKPKESGTRAAQEGAQADPSTVGEERGAGVARSPSPVGSDPTAVPEPLLRKCPRCGFMKSSRHFAMLRGRRIGSCKPCRHAEHEERLARAAR